MKFFDYKVKKVEISEVEIRVTLTDGREAALLISDFPLLKEATSSQRKNIEVINGYALYWPELGEDLSIAGFFEKEMISNDHK